MPTNTLETHARGTCLRVQIAMSLFQLGTFRLASGQETNWKIECDALTKADWEALAAIIGSRVEFGDVRGVPRGGLKLERALRRFIRPGNPDRLIVDDVYTTGRSMTDFRDRLILDGNEPECTGRHIGVVVFARAPIIVPHNHNAWISALFQMGSLGQNRAAK